jgi:hypothetical protein
MTLNLSTLRTELREHIGFGDENEVDDANRSFKNVNADLLLNRSWWEVADKFPFREKECTTTFQTSDGDDYYSLPSSFESLRHLSIQDPVLLNWKPLDRMGVDWLERESDDNPDSRSRPERYFRDNIGIRLQPIPDTEYTVRVKYLIELSNLATLGPEVPRIWHEIVLFGAVWRGHFRLQDYNKAQAVKIHQLALLNSTTPVESKEETDSSRAGVEVPEELTKI